MLIYLHDLSYARVHGETEQAKAFIATVVEFSARLREVVNGAIDGYHFDSTSVVTTLSAEFGFRFLSDVIAYTVSLRPYDGRIGRMVKEWAEGVERPYLLRCIDSNLDSVHSVYLDSIAREIIALS